MDLQKFAVRLRQLREAAHLTQKQLGKMIGAKPTTVSSWELAHRMPELDAVCKLADFFEVSLDYLLGRSDDPAIREVSNDAGSTSAASAFYARLNRLLPEAREKVLQELEWWEKYSNW